MNLEMPHLHQLRSLAPRTAMGRTMAAWPVIAANLRAGKRLREVWEAAEQDGLNVPYAVFKTYVQRLRRRDECHRLPDLSGQPRGQTIREIRPTLSNTAGKADPLRNLREQRAKNRGFEFSPFPKQGLTK